MLFSSGTRLGPFEVLTAIGAGGMGEVYKARDTRLGRDVAIKVLPAEVAADPGRRRRFEQEARAVSALNHPHICVLHDIGCETPVPDSRAAPDGPVPFLVMEYLDGQTLEHRLRKGSVPLDQALDLGVQIAGGLATAHRHGIVHRDLKPANIMLTSSGAKLLDFGLARTGASAAGVGATMVPTMPADITAEGTVLGTFQYMAPEQVEGAGADARSDIFAFGCVLFEMLTGRKAFEGKTRASLISAILKDEPPPVSELQPAAPVSLDRLVATCVAKDPDNRWQSVRDLMRELQWVAEGSASLHSGAVTASRPAPRSAWSRALPWVTGPVGIALGAALLAWSPWLPRPSTPPVTRITLSLSRDNALAIEGGIAISPDGRTVAFIAGSAQGSRLYVRRLDEWEPHALPLTEGASYPFFSPDGRWVAFARGSGLEKTPVSGGPPQVICNKEGAEGRWQSDGTIVFGAWPGVGLWRVSSDGGTPRLIAKPREGSAVRYVGPDPLPGDRGILLTVYREGRTSIAVLPPGADTPRVLVESGSHPLYLPTGHLVYVADRHLLAVPFDVDRLEVRGGAVVVVDDVNDTPWTRDYDVSANGVLVYQTAGSYARHVVWKDRQGLTVPVGASPRAYKSPALSPDGKRLSVMIVEGSAKNIWAGQVSNEPLTRLTFGNDDWFGVWSRDGSRLFYTAGEDGTYNIFSIPTNGSGKAERLTRSPNPQNATSLSPDGGTLLFHDIDPLTKSDIWALSLATKECRPLVKTPFDEGDAQFSPDGHWIAYDSDESGQDEVYLQAYPGPGVRRRVSLDRGWDPFWSHTGRELFYLTATAMFAVPILDARDLRTGTPRRLFATSIDMPLVCAAQTSADDQRFLMLENAEAHQTSQLNVAFNWFEELKAKVPVKR